MVKHIQTIRGQFADEFFECVWPFCGIRRPVSRGIKLTEALHSMEIVVLSF